ncbi:MAG: hypothetical protein P1V18_03430 [Candidatus Gracilibacteria bacterium]|nr:hypothetical protein [Candidatus Gracilibacteria bacterium]
MNEIPVREEEDDSLAFLTSKYQMIHAQFIAVEMRVSDLQHEMSERAFKIFSEMQQMTDSLEKNIADFEGQHGDEESFRNRLCVLLKRIDLAQPPVLKKISGLRMQIELFEAYQNPQIDFENAERVYLNLRKKIVCFSQYFRKRRQLILAKMTFRLVEELDALWAEKSYLPPDKEA